MKFVDQSYEILHQSKGIDGMYEQIERAGRICYKSIGTRYFKWTIPNDFRDASEDDKKKYEALKSSIHIIYRLMAGNWNLELNEITDTNKTTTYFLSVDNKAVKQLPVNILEYETTLDKEPSSDPFENVSAQLFVENTLKVNGHYAMLEHGTVYLDVPCYRLDIFFRYAFNHFTRSKLHKFKFLITTNYRVIVEKNRECDMKFFSADPQYHYKKRTVKFTTDRGGSHSIVRHRGEYGVSFAQESTRSCDYTKKKFDGVTFIIPRWIYKLRDKYAKCINSLDKTSNEWMLDYNGEELVRMMTTQSRAVSCWYDDCKRDEEDYIYLIKEENLLAQDARGILPTCIKTELVMTAFDKDWKHFFDLRDESHAHPDIQWLAHKLHNESIFKEL